MEHSVALLGPKGTFSDVAFSADQQQKRRLESSSIERPHDCNRIETPHYCNSIDAVFAAVGNSCVAGLVPIENTLDGYLQRTLDLLLETPVRIERELQLPIQFSLIANAASVGEIKTLYVQFKASGQCRNWIGRLEASGVEVVLTQSNMASFAEVERYRRSGDAAIIPAHQRAQAAACLCLENVTDAAHNCTRFIRIVAETGDRAASAGLLAETGEAHAGSTRLRVPLYLLPSCDRPGILYELLQPLHAQQINLVSIISRPTKKHMGTYHFYLELEGLSSQQEQMATALSQLSQHASIKLLGAYPICEQTGREGSKLGGLKL